MRETEIERIDKYYAVMIDKLKAFERECIASIGQVKFDSEAVETIKAKMEKINATSLLNNTQCETMLRDVEQIVIECKSSWDTPTARSCSASARRWTIAIWPSSMAARPVTSPFSGKSKCPTRS